MYKELDFCMGIQAIKVIFWAKARFNIFYKPRAKARGN
jgi:hypothetical protein